MSTFYSTDQEKLSSSVLSHLLAERPSLFSLEELVRLFNREPFSFEASDSMRVTLDELSACGLVHRIGSFYFATYAAARSEQLRL